MQKISGAFGLVHRTAGNRTRAYSAALRRSQGSPRRLRDTTSPRSARIASPKSAASNGNPCRPAARPGPAASGGPRAAWSAASGALSGEITAPAVSGAYAAAPTTADHQSRCDSSPCSSPSILQCHVSPFSIARSDYPPRPGPAASHYRRVAPRLEDHRARIRHQSRAAKTGGINDSCIGRREDPARPGTPTSNT